MGEISNVILNKPFHRRVATTSHSMIIIALAILALIYLETVLKPFFIAMAIYFVLKPGADKLSDNGFPEFLSFLTMLLLAVLVVTSTAFFAWSQAQDFTDDEELLIEYDHKLDRKWNNLKDLPVVGPLLKDLVKGDSDTVGGDLADVGVGSGGPVTEALVSMLSGIGGALTTGVTVLFFLIFIIFEAHLLPGRIDRAWPGGTSHRMELITTQIQESVNTYIVVKTGCGFGTALLAGIIMWMYGIDLWFVWAVMTFVFNYVPYIGSLIATIPPIFLGLIILTPPHLMMLIFLLLLNQQVWGNYIETKWAGRALDLSPVVLLLLTAFSFWLWGIVGMVLAVPLFVIVKIVLENIEETRPFAILISERAPTLEEAWSDALRDGVLSVGETRKLKDLQKMLGVSDEATALVAGRSSAATILKRGRAKQQEIDFILLAAKGTPQESNLIDKLLIGRLSKEVRPHLKDLIAHLIDDEEE
ncbi:MAG: AI-2E family transporter [Candidatus Poseidoniales archaeon]